MTLAQFVRRVVNRTWWGGRWRAPCPVRHYVRVATEWCGVGAGTVITCVAGETLREYDPLEIRMDGKVYRSRDWVAHYGRACGDSYAATEGRKRGE